jgi:nicotinate-nucleotide adenylyltransferase
MRIGFLLGSFDPIHIGHICTAATALNMNLVDRVLVTPTVHNPWKEKPAADFDIRCKWIKRLMSPFGKKAGVCIVEKYLKEPYYSCYTLDMISKKYGKDNELYIICGSDVINSIKSWKNYDTMIKDRYKYIVFERSDVEIKETDIEYKLYQTEIPDVSSTKIKELMDSGNSPYPYIPDLSVSQECLEFYHNSDYKI